MGKDYKRTDRVADLIQRELAMLIPREVKDPRLGMVTVSGVEVTRDLAHAKVFISLFDGEKPGRVDDTLAILKNTAGYLRHLLGQSLKLRVIPNLHFIYDGSAEEGARISRLLAEARQKDMQNKDES